MRYLGGMLGEQLGPYVVEEKLGAGGMGTVYRAMGPAGPVALKVLHPHLLEIPDAAARMQREIEIGKTVWHDNVVRTYEGGEANGHAYIAMELVEGQTLLQLLSELERVPEELCRHIGREVCKGLDAIHAVGAIHRDVKPENVLITADHVVKLMDLGVARQMDDKLRLSQSGVFVGSLRYASPEQLQSGGKGLDARSDLHALGFVLYELSCGAPPFDGDDASEVIRSVCSDEPRRLGDINPQLSPFFEEVVHTLLRKNRDERFRTAAELRVVLEDGEDSAWWHERARALRVETRRPLRRIRIPRETAVYGRDGELALLSGLFDQANKGDGQVVLLQGEAGVGKSRLVDELIRRLQEEGEEIDFLFGSYPPGGAATVAGAFSTAYREHFGEQGSAAYLPENQALVPAFDALLRGDPAPSGAAPLNKGSLQTCFVRATQGLAAERVAVILIDDLHFAPGEGRALFTSLALSVTGHRVLLIGTMRDGVDEDWVAGVTRLDHAAHLQIARLGAKDLVQMLEDSLRSRKLAEELGVRIAVKSDGNPFFVFEIIRCLRDGGLLRQSADGSWVTTQVIDEIEIPSSVLDLVNARVASLSEDERNLLDVAACWGYSFDPLMVGEVLGIARIPLLRQLAQIERKHRLVRAAGVKYVFDHHQVQEALYGSLSELLRREYHGALADACAARATAGGVALSEVTGPAAVDIADHYLLSARPQQALVHVDAAVAHLWEGFVQERIVVLLTRVLDAPGLVTGVHRARLLSTVSKPLAYLSRWDDQLRVLDEALELATTADDKHLQSTVLLLLSGRLIRVGRYEDAHDVLVRVLALARETGDRTVEAACNGNLATVLGIRGEVDEALEKSKRVLAIEHEVGNRVGIRISTVNLGNTYFRAGRFAEAREQFLLHQEICRRDGDRAAGARSLGNLGGVCISEGRIAEAETHYRRQLEISGELGDRLSQAYAYSNLGHVSSELGRYDQAREEYKSSLEISHEIGHRRGEATAHHNLGSVATSLRELETAGVHLRASLAIAEDIGLPNVESLCHLDLSYLFQLREDEPNERRHLDEADRIATATNQLTELVLARCRLALLPGGDVGRAIAALGEYEARIRAPSRCKARYLLWRATDDLVHLTEARRLVDEAVAGMPDEARQQTLTHNETYSAVLSACEEEGIA